MGLGLLSGRAAPPPFFVFLGWGACARVRAGAGVWRVWLVACVRLGAKGARGERASGCVSVVGCPAGRGRGLAPGGVARASVVGLLLAFARVAGCAWSGGVWCTRTWWVGDR